MSRLFVLAGDAERSLSPAADARHPGRKGVIFLST